MARPTKMGLDYFPLDVDIFEDNKIQLMSAKFGIKGEIITIRLLCKIYKNGYYLDWDEDTSILFAKSVGGGCQHTLVNDVIHELIRRGFLNESIFNSFAVLTSKGIQERFFEAATRRKSIEIKKEYLLIDIPKNINVNINSVNVCNNSINVDINPQSKVKESKVKESKVNKLNNTLANILKYYETHLSITINQTDVEFFENWLSKLSVEFLEKAIDIAKEKRKTRIYIDGILRNWHKQGFKHIEQVTNKQVTNKDHRHYMKYDVVDFSEYDGLLDKYNYVYEMFD